MKFASRVIVLPIDKIVDSLKREEGFRAYVYADHLGYHTIGYGRCVQEGQGLGITEEEAEILLRSDVGRTVEEVRANFNWFNEAPTKIQSVIIEVAFQLGLPRLRQFRKMLEALSHSDYKRAAEELVDSLYYRQCPQRVTRYAERLRS